MITMIRQYDDMNNDNCYFVTSVGIIGIRLGSLCSLKS